MYCFRYEKKLFSPGWKGARSYSTFSLTSKNLLTLLTGTALMVFLALYVLYTSLIPDALYT